MFNVKKFVKKGRKLKEDNDCFSTALEIENNEWKKVHNNKLVKQLRIDKILIIKKW